MTYERVHFSCISFLRSAHLHLIFYNCLFEYIYSDTYNFWQDILMDSLWKCMCDFPVFKRSVKVQTAHNVSAIYSHTKSLSFFHFYLFMYLITSFLFLSNTYRPTVF